MLHYWECGYEGFMVVCYVQINLMGRLFYSIISFVPSVICPFVVPWVPGGCFPVCAGVCGWGDHSVGVFAVEKCKLQELAHAFLKKGGVLRPSLDYELAAGSFAYFQIL